MNPLVLLIGIGAFIYLFSHGNAINALQFNANGISFSGGKLILSLQLTNPSNTEVTLSSLTGNIVYSGATVGNVSYLGLVVIPPLSKVNIPLNIAINTLGIAQDALLLLNGGGTNGRFVLNAAINFNGVVMNKAINF